MPRISSNGATFQIEQSINATITITGITLGVNPTLTATAITPIAPGDIVAISGTGRAALDDRLFQAGATTATSVVLLGANTTGLASITTGVINRIAMIEMPAASINRQSPDPAVIDVTTLSDTARRKLMGLTDFGNFTFDGPYDIDEPGHAAFRAASQANSRIAFAIRLRDTSAVMWRGYAGAFSETLGLDQAMNYSAGGTIDGAVTFSPRRL